MENHFHIVSHIVSKVHIFPNLIVKNSEKDSTVDNDINEFIEYLYDPRIENSRTLIISNLSINSIRNKVDMLSYMIGNNKWVKARWNLSKFSVCNRTFYITFQTRSHKKWRGISLYVKNNKTTLLTKFNLPKDIEALFVEIVIGKTEWLLCCSYNRHKCIIVYHLQEIGIRFGVLHLKLQESILNGWV